MTEHIVLGIHVTERVKQAQRIQQLFTDYGCNIKTRVGLHDASHDMCAAGGLILLEMVGETAKAYELHDRLTAIEGVHVQKMVFGHSK